MCEDVIVRIKIVAECQEDVLLEVVAIQQAQERIFHLIQYLYLDDTPPEGRKRQKKCADLCEVRSKVGAIEEFTTLQAARIQLWMP